MSDLTNHSRIAKTINEAQFKHPHLRVGQLIYNALYDHFGEAQDLFYVSDEDLAWALEPYEL